MFDWIHPGTERPTPSSATTSSDIIGMRFDYNF